MEERTKRLIEFCQGIYSKENGKALYEKYYEDIQAITPQDLMLIQHEQLKLGLSVQEMLDFVDKLINVFHKPLSVYSWKHPAEGTFLYYLIEENAGLVAQLERFKDIVKKDDISAYKDELGTFIDMVTPYGEHLLKLENILFPYLEKKMERYEGLKILWALHDETRRELKDLAVQLTAEPFDERSVNIGIGQLYFKLYGLVQKQELILFPCATEVLEEADFAQMHKQSFEYGFPFIEKPEMSVTEADGTGIRYGGLQKLFVTDTGHFDLEQLDLILGALPVDITLVDENDKVAYFSRPKERIFPRSAAVIGRDVRNCHPSDSVHVVMAIIEAFKKGERDSANFWIQMRGMFIYIEYVALRNSDGTYRGTLEITQELSKLRALEGQQRLLNWE